MARRNYPGTDVPKPFFTSASQFVAANQNKFSIADNAALSHTPATSFYYCGWVYFDNVTTQQCILNKGASLAAGNQSEFSIWLTSTGILRATIYDGTNPTSSSWGTALSAQQWYFVEGYYDSSFQRVRINVNQGTSLGVAQTAGSWDSTFAFNFGSSGTADYLSGRLYSWAYYNAIPSTTVMTELYNSGLGKQFAQLSTSAKTNLVAWYDFGQSSGVLADKQSTNNMTASTNYPPSIQARPDSISILTPLANQLVQRTPLTRVGRINLSGLYSGSPSDIEVRYKGGNWQSINASIANGQWSGVLPDQPVGTGGSVDVRFKNNTSITASVTIKGIGIRIALDGQSNCSGRGTYNQVFTQGKATATMFGNDYVFKALIDPTDSSTSQVDGVSSEAGAAAGSVWPLVATIISAKNDIPIEFVPNSKGGSSIIAWQPGANHFDRNTLYGSSTYRNTFSGGVEIKVWWQLETDAQNGMAAATYQGYYETMAAATYADLGCKVIPMQIQTCASIPQANQDALNSVIAFEWANNANTVKGADLRPIQTDSPDGLHLWGNDKLAAAAQLIAPALTTALGLAA